MLSSLRYTFKKDNERVSKMAALSKAEMLELENIVSGLLKQFGYDEKTDISVDIARFAGELGFRVGVATLPENEDGLIVIRSHDLKRDDSLGDKVIAVNRDRSFLMKRFTVAYEFAYSVLNYEKTNYFSHHRLVSERANEDPKVLYFVSALLMPRKSFVKKVKDLKSIGITGNALIFQLASIFRVSETDVIDRIDCTFFLDGDLETAKALLANDYL